MSYEEIKKIDLCENCFMKKAEYSFYKKDETIFQIRIQTALLCKDCVRELRRGKK